METNVDFTKLYDKLSSKDVRICEMNGSRLMLIKEASVKFHAWANKYADIVSDTIEKYDLENAQVETNEVKDMFNQTFQKPVKQNRPKADRNRIARDIVENWYKILVYTVDREARRKARRTVWHELTTGKFTSWGTAKMLRDAMDKIVSSYN